MSATIGLVIYQFMAGVSESDLDLNGSAKAVPVTCVTEWVQRSDAESWYTVRLWEKWIQYVEDSDNFVQNHLCEPPEPYEQTCMYISIPVNQIQGQLGYPLGEGEKPSINNDILYFYAYIFLVLGLANLVGFLVHDWALISSTSKDYVLDWSGLHKGYPCLWVVWSLTGIPSMRSCLKDTGRRRVWWLAVAITLFPVLICWNIVVFFFLLLPVLLFLFIRHPIRLCRFWIFYLLLNAAVYGLIMTIHQIVLIADAGSRPRYAITWAAGECRCGCSYSMASLTHWRLLAVGVGVVIQSILSAFRCLKGLRRAQWANMMSVTFPVPVGAYSVYWTTPSGAPIRHRTENEPVQGEKAFDPFALMDEQPESKYTTVTLKPEFAYIQEEGVWKPRGMQRAYEGPSVPEVLERDKEVHMQPTEFIGCCGFPCLTGGYQAVLVIDSDEEEMPPTVPDVVVTDPQGAHIAHPAEGAHEGKHVAGRHSPRPSAGSVEADHHCARPRAPTEDSGQLRHAPSAPSTSPAKAAGDRPRFYSSDGKQLDEQTAAKLLRVQRRLPTLTPKRESSASGLSSRVSSTKDVSEEASQPDVRKSREDASSEVPDVEFSHIGPSHDAAHTSTVSGSEAGAQEEVFIFGS